MFWAVLETIAVLYAVAQARKEIVDSEVYVQAKLYLWAAWVPLDLDRYPSTFQSDKSTTLMLAPPDRGTPVRDESEPVREARASGAPEVVFEFGDAGLDEIPDVSSETLASIAAHQATMLDAPGGQTAMVADEFDFSQGVKPADDDPA